MGQQDDEHDEPGIDAATVEAVAAVLRRRAGERPLWIDVAGSSMAPRIPSGARVLVVADGRPTRGAIWVAADLDGRILVHRVLGRAGRWWWLQGDANPAPDPPVGEGQLVGRVAAIEIGGLRRRVGALARLRGRLLVDARAARRRLQNRVK
jgi:hypothetical protein